MRVMTYWSAVKYVVSYLVLYAATLGLLAYYEDFDIIEPLMILAIVGGGFTLVAWLLTRRAERLPVADPKRDVIWYLLVADAEHSHCRDHPRRGRSSSRRRQTYGAFLITVKKGFVT